MKDSLLPSIPCLDTPRSVYKEVSVVRALRLSRQYYEKDLITAFLDMENVLLITI